MKTLPPALLAEYDRGTTTMSYAIRVQREDGQVFAYTSAQRSVLLDNQVYTRSSLTLSDVVTSADMSVGNMDFYLYAALDDPVFNNAEIFGGIWRNAEFEIFEYNRASPADGKNPIVSGTFGEITIHSDHYQVELRDWLQYLQQPIGEASSKNCRNRLGDENCKVDLAPFTVSGTITSVTSPQVFQDSARTEADDWFAEGVLTFTSGACAGMSQKVKFYSADGTVTLSLPMFSAVEEGDGYTMVAGCRKRHDRTLANPSGASDCLDKFNNVLNFRGEPHRPGVDKITGAPDPIV